MAITVRQLIDQHQLPLTLRAGESGLDREIMWVHASDLPEPWQYLVRSEALLTNGTGMTGDPWSQVRFIGRLERAGASALGYGLETGPSLTNEAVQEADRIGLPLFTMPRQTRFSALAQYVAHANATQQQRELHQVARLYEVLHSALASQAGTAEVLARLGEEINARLCLVHLADGRAAMGSPESPYAGQVMVAHQMPELRADLVRLTRRTGSAGQSAVMVPLEAGESPFALIVEVPEHRVPSRTLLQHLAVAIAVELAQLHPGRDLTRTPVLLDLLTERLAPERAEEELASRGLRPGHCLMVVARRISAPGTGTASYLPPGAWAGARYVSTAWRNAVYALVDPGDREDQIDGAALSGWVVGVSRPLGHVTRLHEAASEAEWTAARSYLNDVGVGYFSDVAEWVEPRSEAEAIVRVRRTIAPLVEQDATRGSSYVRTLKVWLVNDRSWNAAADALGIHKQTLGYRLRRIEALVGHGITSTRDVVDLWTGLQAHDLLDLTREWGSPGHEDRPVLLPR